MLIKHNYAEKSLYKLLTVIQQKHIMFKILPCCNKIYVVRCIYTKMSAFYKKNLKKTLRH